jgi:hypothetical protein
VNIEDDAPQAIQPKTVTLNNAIGASGSNYLDDDNDIDGTGGTGDVGADGGKVIFTAASITALTAQNLASGFSSLNYSINGDGTVLTATKSSDASVVFTISLQRAAPRPVCREPFAEGRFNHLDRFQRGQLRFRGREQLLGRFQLGGCQ